MRIHIDHLSCTLQENTERSYSQSNISFHLILTLDPLPSVAQRLTNISNIVRFQCVKY